MNTIFRFLITFLFALHLTAGSAVADTGNKQTEVLLKTLNYVRGLDLDTATKSRIGVVYNAGSAQSKNEAEAIKRSLEQAKSSLSVRLVSVQALVNADSFEVFVVGKGLSGYFDKIKSVSEKKEIFTISMDVECARQDCCALALNFEKSVKIYLNESVLEKTGFDIDSTFRYLAIRV